MYRLRRTGRSALTRSSRRARHTPYRGAGRWSDYAYGGKAYLVLSLAAKSLLAWQVFAGSPADRTSFTVRCASHAPAPEGRRATSRT
ncbi:hypothetical protein [Streptomyces lavendulocolor]|uniref:hypothetical protein n=1 Tax=Streptomyces lavendulocolor TaxID=67316 RepID=UPI003C30A1A5